MLDEVKEAKRKEVSKKLWDDFFWEGKYEEKFYQWARDQLCPFYVKRWNVDSAHIRAIPIHCRAVFEDCKRYKEKGIIWRG